MSRPRDLRHLDPEVRKERVKLLASGLNAVGLALLIGSVIAPTLDASRHVTPARLAGAVALGLAAIVTAYYILRYIKRLED